MFGQAARASEGPSTEDAAEHGGCGTFEAVYEKHFAFVWRTVRRLGVGDSAVEDVTQDVFLVVHRRLPNLAPGASIKPWLFGIVVRVVSDTRRTLRRKPAHLGGHARSGRDVDSVPDPSAVCPHQSAERADAIRTLHALLDRMRDQHRQVFILSELEQMSAVDIAAAVNANVNTVYSRLRAARSEFQTALARLHASGAWRIR